MKLTNDSYFILLHSRNCTERYYRDSKGWVKISTRGRKFRMTAEQALNHLLPAFAGVKQGLRVEVQYRYSTAPGRTKRAVIPPRGLAGPRRT